MGSLLLQFLVLPVLSSIDAFDESSDFLKWIPWTSILDLNPTVEWLQRNKQHFKLNCAMQYSNTQLADYGTKRTLYSTSTHDFSHLATQRLNDSMLIVIAGFGDFCQRPESWEIIQKLIERILDGNAILTTTPVIRLLSETYVPLPISHGSSVKDWFNTKLCSLRVVQDYVK